MSCGWPTDRTCLPVADTPIDTQQQQDAEDLAVSVLWALSGRQFGVCSVVARPCPTERQSYWRDIPGTGWWFPIWDGSNWRNVACGCGPRCDWASPTVIHLASSGLPIQEVLEVRIEDTVLDPSEYKLEGDLLYRIGTRWPRQDLTVPTPLPGSWSVTYTRGNPPPPGTAKLVGLLAQEFLAACTGGKCRLPRRVQTVSRQGVTYNMIDPIDIYASGKTGIPEVDLWLSSVNPHGNQQPATVR